MKTSILAKQKIFLILFLLLGSLLLFDACKKETVDPCDTLTCLNNGVCDNGTCDCPLGYSGTNCEIIDSCYTVACQNGGTCANGVCDCPPGYTGTYCESYDSCYNVVCQNGGTCVNGICDCPPGYVGTYCESYDSCHNVVCQNGGICVNGICDCPLGWGGTNCTIPVAYGTVLVDSIVVNSYPATNNGATWDSPPGTAPDMELSFVRMNATNTGTNYNQVAYLGPLADYTNPTISFPVNRSVTVWSANDKWIFYLRDFEYNGSADLMGEIEFLCDNYRGQSSFTVTSSSSSPHPIAATFYVQWNY